ncbi:bifunctional UDP-N-acetylglucosamine diphosphorylase/glucosamine-1-phosphate N-acetyltransferase GlmU [Alisedimentitalea sp. MJ-SS2]|uniref:bifunctional UDP-N-acetylglucosamine diphosphorylase/glucosamine-1-phosphate N-acetyltransferase GlmU n=1 Tax=Aliisedimentitalea sp. MJ-SS2 TaxID=3049795 RepID=UPI002912B082|nr:bifunctional UDP-N-acetylglucosamine diphosphorylase/glucosamine-1-phosphate N-acetyltransferase GlmU [Alisedimentitalea sp. MJ-SS2]MDU8929012.1 bifunctional UDP-N-acetylglucosamine diphosphorylase/glucosamine-1-phosphate N-acetyltransferase GlmU [Alisedimentitalea sp. MJ-SS2]
MSTALIILAAGKGTRMKSDLPKVLHQVAFAPLLVHAMKSGAAFDPERTIIVAGHGAEAVAAAAQEFDSRAEVVLQKEQQGTGHAVQMAQEALAGFGGDAIVLYGDTPFIRPETLTRMAKARAQHDVVVLGFEAADPGRYGRLVMDGDRLDRIVEFNDASDQERTITLCNSGVIMARTEMLFSLLDDVNSDNASGEYYLTDIIGIANAQGLSATAVTCDEAETLGVNSRAQLAEAEAEFQSRARAEALENSVTLMAPETVYFAHDTVIGRDALIEPNVVFGPGATIESGAHIRAFTHIEGAHVSRGAIVGPYARLRPGAELAENTHVGNFVEIKNATLAEGAKANHLTYIGDAEVGEATNIGAGTITCNYDGVMKHKTTIGARSFIGSNTMLIAPVAVGDEAMTATGAVVNKDVPDGAMAISRAEQVNKPGFARKLMNILRAKKEKQMKERG